MKKYTCFIVFLTLCISGLSLKAQVVDKVVAVVGNNVILKSEIEKQYAQYLAQGNTPDDEVRCYFLQQLLTQKLLAQQAKIDSIVVTEDEVDDNIDNRLRYMVNQAGGQERLEQFLNRSLLQYKEEMREDVREQLVANRMQGKITEDIDITPAEIKRYFDNIPADSLPNYNTEVEIGNIVFQPKLTEEEKKPFKAKAEDIRQQILDGKDFATMARLWSDDPGSASDGGEYPFSDRSTFVKEFTAVAFKAKPGEISKVFETEYGYHFLEVLERRGEQIRLRHILVAFKPTTASLERAEELADSVYTEIHKGELNFSAAAALYSDDKETKYNGGMMLNSENVNTRTTFIPVDQLDADVFSAIDTLDVGEVSAPNRYTGPDGKPAFRLMYLKSRTAPHQANLEQDYAKLKEAARADKVNRVLSEWFEKRRENMYIQIDPEFENCESIGEWL